MPQVNERVLVAVDDSDASRRVLRYVTRILAGRPAVRVVLCHVLPPFPPRRLDLLRADRAVEEHRLNEDVEAARAGWLAEAETIAAPILAEARRTLEEGGIPPDGLEACCPACVAGEDVAETILRSATEAGCGTIVVGRESFGRFRELIAGHVSDEIVRRARSRTVWVVE